MGDPIWKPTVIDVSTARATAFREQLGADGQQVGDDYHALQRWSINEPRKFWAAVWDYCDVVAGGSKTPVLVEGDRFQDARWFPSAKLNFAENLLRCRSNEKLAIISILEDGRRKELSYASLYTQVAQMASALRARGVSVGDRVGAYMPNVEQTIISMLAVTSIGAIWSSCSPDFGPESVAERFDQIDPKVLIVCSGYYYNGKYICLLDRLARIIGQLESVETMVVVDIYKSERDKLSIPRAVLYDDFIDSLASDVDFTRLAFNHPVAILYSSGTTGKPKCITHGAGGTLLQHLKEHQLQLDLRSDDVFFYFTTCGWMMWNWLVSGLASSATLVLYDGAPLIGDGLRLINLIDEESISIFGTSARYIQELENMALEPKNTHSLSSLRTILSTGSPLLPASFRYIYRSVKKDVCLSSMSGGTDIISCFVGGSRVLPVYEGEIQASGLGMAVEVWDSKGESVKQGIGELVCTQPFPSAPVGFWGDQTGERYESSYFETFPAIWAHGDLAEQTDNGGWVIHGRSDSVLNPGGVRIGTAEIYRQVDQVKEVVESIAIGQHWENDTRVVLFVVLRGGLNLDDSLIKKIKTTIRANATPRHVPSLIIQVEDLPKTMNGKLAEVAVRDVVNGKQIANESSLANPETLAQFQKHPALISN